MPRKPPSMKRRLFLRGLGGACVAAPFLGSLGGRAARAQVTPNPRRLIVMFTHYGCLTNRFFPQKSHGELTAADYQPTTLGPLAQYAKDVLLPRGIRAMNEWTPDLSRGQGNDIHYHAGSFFTCQPLQPNVDDPFSLQQTALFSPKPVGRSLDHVIAEQLSPDGIPLYVRLGNSIDGAVSNISFSDDSTAFAGLGSAAQLYTHLTGLFDAATVSPDSYRAMRGKSVLDLVKDDLDTLERFEMSQADRMKLEAWKALLHDTGAALPPAACSAETAELFGVTADRVAAGTSTLGSDAISGKGDGILDGADLYSSLAVLAALCNLNPVIVLKYPGSFIYKGLGLTLDNHSISHRIGSAALTGICTPTANADIARIDEFYASKFAYLVSLLNGVTEGDGRLLDSTAAVWFQEMSDGLVHNLNNLPIVQAGSLGGYFKTGGAINVEDGSPDLTAGNSEARCTSPEDNLVMQLDGATGTDPSLANAPINKYFCNLMNALGVKAGPDGFPLLGGTEEVRCFGMYDRTEDFIGGGTVDPKIHDPGEFSALRANS